jgi:hypothetical protein
VAALLALGRSVRPDLLHVQHDAEVRAVGLMRASLVALGVRTYLPADETIALCLNKACSYERWAAAGLRVPLTILIRTPGDLREAFSRLGGRVWLRAVEGAGGHAALPTDDEEFARRWIERYAGWGAFTAAEVLTERTVTWTSLWHDGELVVAQTRRRIAWSFGNRTLSGVTGVTGVGETASDGEVDRIALAAIDAVDERPHGIFAVDMTYDDAGVPNPTEINIGRFFTTHYFFSRAGLNLPAIYRDIALRGAFPALERRINPLPDGLVWIRGMDVEPVLVSRQELRALEDARRLTAGAGGEASPAPGA